jgi:hypothetical protein
MIERRHILAGGVAILGGIVYALVFRQTDEGRIRAQLTALAAAVRVEDGPGNRVFRAAHLKDAYARIFAPRVELDVADLAHETTRREDLVGLTLALQAPLRTAALDFSSVRVQLESPADSARVTGTATGSGVEGGGQMRVERRAFTMRFEKVDGIWRIAAVSASVPP